MADSGQKINYSLRPQKCVERKIMCELLSTCETAVPIHKYRYIGFGSFSKELWRMYIGLIQEGNIIIDYTVDGKLYPNHDIEKLQENFDYYSWNPYFDGNFDMDRAKQRFKKYITNEKVTQK